jgi:hypothetical protein
MIFSPPRLLLFLLLIILILQVPALAQESATGIHRCGLMVGTVVDPATFGVEQMHGAAAVVFAYQKRLANRDLPAISLRPTILFNSRSFYFRVPVFLELPMALRYGKAEKKADTARFALLGSAGLGTWDGEPISGVKPLFSGGAELALYPLSLCALATFVVEQENIDSLVDIFLSYYWEL